MANNSCFDTATDIIEIQYLSKSQVSSSIKLLEQRGCLRKEYANQNHKTAHLKICGAAMDIIRDGKSAQEQFLAILLNGFSQEEIVNINNQIWYNIDSYLKNFYSKDFTSKEGTE